jgi:hypothetical protein
MANDELKVKMSLQDEYTAKMKHAHAATQQFGQGITSAQSSIMGLGSAMTGIGTALAAGGLLAGLTMIAKKSWEANAVWVRYTKTMEGFLGSAQAAKEAMDWLKTYQEPSLFELDPLVQAANLLTAFKMDFREVLPLAENLAVAFGKLTPDALLEIISALGRIKSGRMMEGLESLSSYGVNRKALSNEGIKFDKQGSPEATPDEFLAAVMRVAKGFDPVRKLMAETPEAKWSTFLEKIAGMWRSIGAVVGNFVAPILDKITSAMSYLVNSGAFTDIANGFLAMFNTDVSGGGLEKGITGIVALIKTIPSLMQAFGSSMKVAFTVVTAIIAPVFDLLKSVFGNPMIQMILTFVGVIFILVKAWQAYTVTQAAANAALLFFEGLTGVGIALVLAAAATATAVTLAFNDKVIKPLNSSIKTAEGDFAKFQKEFAAASSVPTALAPSSPSAPATPALDKAINDIKVKDATTGALGTIASNTGETARNTKALRDAAKDYAFGGGDVASRGISKVTMARGTRNLPVKVQIAGGSDAITRLFEQMVNKVLMAHQATNGGF